MHTFWIDREWLTFWLKIYIAHHRHHRRPGFPSSNHSSLLYICVNISFALSLSLSISLPHYIYIDRGCGRKLSRFPLRTLNSYTHVYVWRLVRGYARNQSRDRRRQYPSVGGRSCKSKATKLSLALLELWASSFEPVQRWNEARSASRESKAKAPLTIVVACVSVRIEPRME